MVQMTNRKKFSKQKFCANNLFVVFSTPRVRANIGDWKVLLVAAFHQDQLLTYEILPNNQYMNGERFLAFLRNTLYPAIRRKKLVRPLILMDNARPHFARIVKEYIEERNWVILKQDPYSPDENPCDYDGFGRIKNRLRGTRYPDRQALINAFTQEVEALNGNRSFTGIASLPATWQSIITAEGNYVH